MNTHNHAQKRKTVSDTQGALISATRSLAPQASSLPPCGGLAAYASPSCSASPLSSSNLIGHGIGLVSISKGKTVVYPFKAETVPSKWIALFDKYPILEMDTGNDILIFSPDWDMHLNHGILDSKIALEMLDKSVLP